MSVPSNLALQAGLSLASPGGTRGRLSILIFHRVLPAKDELLPDLPDAAEFERKMHWVRRWFDVLPLSKAIERLFDGSLPRRALSITFDDGYADNEQIAAPLLQRLGLSATFFVTTGFLHGDCMWNDRVIEGIRATRRESLDPGVQGLSALPLDSLQARRDAIHRILGAIKHLEQGERDAAVARIVERCAAPPIADLMMREHQVRRLRELGMEVGAHTVTHPILARMAPEAARSEIDGGKRELEQIVGAPVRLFAYPNGVPVQDYTTAHVRMVRDAGFTAAVSTAWGSASRGSDRFQLPRFTPWDGTAARFGVRMALNLMRRPLTA